MTQHVPKKPYYQAASPDSAGKLITETFSEWAEEQRDHYYKGESIFALGNGYLGLRGAFEEGLSYALHPNQAGSYRLPDTKKLKDDHFLSVDGTYINGFYESKPIHYPESGYGYAENSQTMLNAPNGKMIHVLLDDGTVQDELHIDTGRLEAFTRTLNMDAGLLERTLVWHSEHNLRVKLEVRRLVSFRHQHIAAIEFRLTPYFNGRVQLESILDGSVENVTAESDPRVGSHLQGCVLHSVNNPILLDKAGEGGILVQATERSGLILASAMLNVLDGTSRLNTSPAVEPVGEGGGEKSNCIRVVYDVQAQDGQPITLHKFLAYHYTESDGTSTQARDLAASLQTELVTARSLGFAGLEREQREYMQHFWEQADVTITGKSDMTDAPNTSSVARLQLGIRFNMFHLLQAAGRDGRTNLGSKGLTGEGYEGHYFWDTEMFAAPFFQYVAPEVCLNLLQYRSHILDHARARARTLSHPKGAAYPWRTINGEECSSFFPAGTAQYHINADIAYAVKSYVAATGDTAFLIEQGAEIVFETARLWADLGAYVSPDRFCIHGVTGPDEYTTIVDNNCYTNLMAQENLRYACEVARWLKESHPDAYADITSQLSPPLAEDELTAWERAAEAMVIPYNAQTGMFAQNDGFFDRPAWRWDWGKRDGKEVLLSRFHYLVIYRHQVCKQADVMLALFLLHDHATLDEKRLNYDYYEAITTHDSSLSTCTFGILASEIGYHSSAYRYFMQTALTDLDDVHDNVTAGVHIANMAGTWMSIVNGFAGLRLDIGDTPGQSVPHYKPYLPDEWADYSFRVHHQHSILQVTVSRESDNPDGAVIKVEYQLKPGDNRIQPLNLKHYDTAFTLDENHPRRTFVLGDEANVRD